jgi:hypothetical protein
MGILENLYKVKIKDFIFVFGIRVPAAVQALLHCIRTLGVTYTAIYPMGIGIKTAMV